MELYRKEEEAVEYLRYTQGREENMRRLGEKREKA